MKHLKRIFESTIEDSMIEDLKDIILDVKDLGFFTNVKADQYIITVTISRLRSTRGFIRNNEEKSQLIDVLNRIKDYCRINKYLVDTTWLGRVSNMSKEEFDQIISDNRFTMDITMYPKKR